VKELLEKQELGFIGMGVSAVAKGALEGQALMPAAPRAPTTS